MTRWLAALVLMTAMTGAAQAADIDTLKRIKDRKSIVLGYPETSAPFAFVGADGKPAGYSIDLCTWIVGDIQKALSLPDLQVRWVKATTQNRFAMVLNGTIDLECGSTTNTLSRQEQVDFSNLTFVDGGGLLTKDPAINGVRDLGGKRAAVIPGTTTETALADAARKLSVAVQMVPVKDRPEGLAALEEGRADAYASDRLLLIGLGRSSKDRADLMVAPEYFSYEPYGLMMRRGDPPFRLSVNRAIARLYRSDELSRIVQRWFGDLGRPAPLLEAMFMLGALPE